MLKNINGKVLHTILILIFGPGLEIFVKMGPTGFEPAIFSYLL